MDGLCRECGYGAGEGHAETCRAAPVSSCDRARQITLTRADLERMLREAWSAGCGRAMFAHVSEPHTPLTQDDYIARVLSALPAAVRPPESGGGS